MANVDHIKFNVTGPAEIHVSTNYEIILPLISSIQNVVWHMPRLHVAWGSSHRWAGIFSAFKSFM